MRGHRAPFQRRIRHDVLRRGRVGQPRDLRQGPVVAPVRHQDSGPRHGAAVVPGIWRRGRSGPRIRRVRRGQTDVRTPQVRVPVDGAEPGIHDGR